MMTDQPTQIRPGEGLDTARLQAYLLEHLPGARGSLEVLQFPSGFSNLTYLLRLGEQELVLRRPPFGASIKTAHDMGREYRILSALKPVYPKVPRPLLCCRDENVLGAPFYVMERLHGVILRTQPPRGLTPSQMCGVCQAALEATFGLCQKSCAEGLSISNTTLEASWTKQGSVVGALDCARGDLVMSKVAVIGAGLVGATTAHTLALRGSCEEVVLLDSDLEKAQAQAVDVAAAATLHRGMRVYSGGYDHLAGAQVVVLAAGVRQKSGESRTELYSSNAPIFRVVVPRVLEVTPEAVFLVATQPVDPLTELTTRLVGDQRAAHVLGVGTVLETMQLRAAVASHLGVSPEHVHGYVIGEQGDSALVVWSNLNIAGLPVEVFAAQRGKPWTQQDQMAITDRVQRSNRRVLEGKGAITYSVGVAIARVIEAILRNAQVVLTVSASEPAKGISYSLPRLVGARGIAATIDPMLSQEESFKLEVLLDSLKNNFEL